MPLFFILFYFIYSFTAAAAANVCKWRASDEEMIKCCVVKSRKFFFSFVMVAASAAAVVVSSFIATVQNWDTQTRMKQMKIEQNTPKLSHSVAFTAAIYGSLPLLCLSFSSSSFWDA